MALAASVISCASQGVVRCVLERTVPETRYGGIVLCPMGSRHERYLAHADACRRKAERAFGVVDRAAWLELANSWQNLSRATESDRQSPTPGDRRYLVPTADLPPIPEVSGFHSVAD
jgi:hypothetical protein